MKLFALLFLTFIVFSCSTSDDPKALKRISEGNKFLDQKNYSSALIAFKDAQKYDLTDESLAKNYRNISICFKNLNLLDSAKVNAKKAYQNAEEYSYYFFNNSGEALLLDNKLEEAKLQFEKAIKKNELGMEANNNLSLLYSGTYDEKFINLNAAIFYAGKAYDANPTATNKEQMASIYFQMENFKQAAKLFSELSNQFPQVKMHQFNYGQCLYFSGKEDEGIALMEDAAERDELCRELFEELIK